MKKYRRVMSRDNEEWCKVWRKTDSWFQKCEKSENLHFHVLLLCQKYIMFEPKKYRGVIYQNTEEWCKIWRETDLSFEEWHEKFCNFWPNTRKSQNLHFIGFFWPKYITFELKCTVGQLHRSTQRSWNLHFERYFFRRYILLS